MSTSSGLVRGPWVVRDLSRRSALQRMSRRTEAAAYARAKAEDQPSRLVCGSRRVTLLRERLRFAWATADA